MWIAPPFGRQRWPSWKGKSTCHAGNPFCLTVRGRTGRRKPMQHLLTSRKCKYIEDSQAGLTHVAFRGLIGAGSGEYSAREQHGMLHVSQPSPDIALQRNESRQSASATAHSSNLRTSNAPGRPHNSASKSQKFARVHLETGEPSMK